MVKPLIFLQIKMVEHHVANVEVTSSNLVTPSNICKIFKELPFVEMKDIILTITHLPFIFILIYIFLEEISE